MKTFILKTDIATSYHMKKMEPVFNNLPNIYRWTVDMHDIDHVLKIEASSESQESEMIELVKTHGFLCEALPD